MAGTLCLPVATTGAAFEYRVGPGGTYSHGRFSRYPLCDGKRTPGIDQDVQSGQRTYQLDARENGRSSRSEEHTSELQSLIRTSYAVFRLNKTTATQPTTKH